MKTNIIPQKPLYRTVLKRVADACNGDEILFMFRYNLTRNNTFLYGCAAICGKTLYSGTENGTISKIEIAKMSDIQYIQYVGCAAIEYTFNGELFELCRSDMKNAIALQSATKRLIAISEGRKFEKSDEEETCCPICGTPYRQGSKTCTLCTDKKKLMFRLYPFAKPHSSKLLIAIILFLAISAINVLTPFLNKILINKYIDAENPSTDGFVLLIAAIAFAALAIAIMQMIRSIILVKVGNKIIVSLREVVYRKVQELSLAGVNKRTVGEIYQRVTQDTNVLKEFLTETLPDVVQMSLVYIAIMTVMLVINWKLTLIVLIPVPLVMLMFYSLRGFMHRLYHRQWQAESDVNTLLNDVFSGIRVVKVFGTEEIENKRFNKSARKVADLSAKNERTWNMIMPFANFLIGIGEYAVLLFAGTQVLNGEMKLGDLSQLLAYVGMLYGPIRYAAFLPRRLTRCMTSLAKVFEIIDEEPEIVDGKNLLDETLNGNLSFKNASFGYNNYENVLKNITLDINKGEMVGIVGRSGVGKSTLINLVMRLYDVTDGEIDIDGNDIRNYSQHSLRSQIGVVLQENFLFRGTIYSNIAYAKPDSTCEDVVKAARIANAHEFIMKQPDGYNTLVGERGLTLSGGERQRIAIARAVLRNPKILILDEATASLDTETEKLIQDSINTLTSGRTTIAIAHRLSTLRNATKLVVLEKGAIEEVGTHDELMRNKGRYYKLVMAQRQMSKMKK